VVFKRLYALGSRARFIGITWHGDTGLDYHKGVFQAFQTGDGLAGALGLNSADVTVAAHSLGNMVVSHAIQSGGFQAKNYFMINAAVPLEAYDSTVLNQKGRGSAYEAMTQSDWRNLKNRGMDERVFASNWHRLFNAKNDKRANLTWKDRFKDVSSRSSVTNFYSPGEDVVENPRSGSAAIVMDMLRNMDTSKGAWGHQEMIKGGAGLGALAFSRVQGGWWMFAPRRINASNLGELKVRPVFFPFIDDVLMAKDKSKASAKAAEPKVQYDLLARGIPAMSYAAAANEMAKLGREGNFNMEALGRGKSSWPADGHSEEFRAGRWIHSDFKNVALPYVHPMYHEMIARGGLNSK
jgi:hypothetical protein